MSTGLRITIKQRLWGASGVALMFFIGAIILGVYGMAVSHNSTRVLFDEVILPLEQISIIDQNFRENRNELHLLWEHAPGRRAASGHDVDTHAIDEHIRAVQARMDASDRVLQTLEQSAASADERAVLRRLAEDKVAWRAFIRESFEQARSATFDPDAALRFQISGTAAYERLSDSLRALRDAQPHQAERIIAEALTRHRLAIGVLVLLGMGGLGVLLFILMSTTERISMGLGEVAGFAEEIAEGNLHADASRRLTTDGDEFDLLMQRIVRTRDSLRMLVSNLHTSEARANAVLRTMRDGVIMISPTGIMLTVNDVVTEMFGYEASELIGNNIKMLMPERHRSRHNYLARYMATREPRILRRRIEVEALCKDGSTLPIDLVVNEMVDDSGSVFVGVVRDIAARKRTQTALEKALEEARVATAAKSDFLAKMSHEIRTPISAVLGLSQLAMRSQMDGRVRAYIEKIHGSAQTLLELVNDILDLSKIEAGALELESIPFDPESVLQNVKAVCGYKARAKELALIIVGIGDVPPKLVGDPTRLTQVLMNLVNNAIKFTPEGRITVTVELMPAQREGDEILLHFTVRDSGIGIAPERQVRLFKEFSQADDSMTRRFGGTGLGLAISKQIVERMGGTVGVVSEAGQGATFWFVVPFAVDSAAEVAPRADLHGRKALIFDAHPDAPALHGYVLGLYGCAVAVCATPSALIERVRTRCDFDIVAMMGEVSDEDFDAFVRVAGACCPGTPVLLLSSGRIGEPPPCAGMRVFMLQRPMFAWKLAALFSDALAARPLHDEGRAAHIRAPALHDYRILLVDDNELNREIGRELLSMAGLSVETVNNGQEAVDAVRAASYDLLLMDLQMPVMDGYTATRTIRAFNKDVTIIALTAHAMSGEMERVLAAGMDDYLTKPIDLDVFYPRIESWLTRKDARAYCASATAEALPDEAPVAAPQDDRAESSEAVAVFDMTSALARVAGRRDMLERFVRMYFERSATQLDELEAALGQADFGTARRHAHALKGGAGTLGLAQLQACFSRIEKTPEAAEAMPDAPPCGREPGRDVRALWDTARHACSEALGLQV